MTIDLLKKRHIEQAASQIDQQGVPKDSIWSQYYVIVNKKEYPFKYLVRTAYKLVSKQKINFRSNDSNRNYVSKLGFEFSYYEGGYNFFTKQELEFYSSIVNSDYRTSNPTHKYYGQKLYPIIAKAKYWAQELLIGDFKLKQDGNWLNGHVARIKPYFWPRIYSGVDKDVFFNVEVNGLERFLSYKLDGYFETKKALPEHKLKLLNEYKDLIDWEWPKIPFDSLEDYDWERLLSESRKYVKKYLPHHNHLKGILSRETKIARITWNTNQWIKPSGFPGKSINPSFEKENGFGHEEWLFDGDKIVNGFKYGFLEPIHKFRSKYEGKVFDISLYTRDGITGNNYWVTTLRDVEIIDQEQADRVLEHYKKEGWFDEMKQDLHNLNLNHKSLDEWIEEDSAQLFNIRFDALQINYVPSQLTPILDSTDIPSTRYTLMDIPVGIQQKYEDQVKKGFSFDDTGSVNADLDTKGTRSSIKTEIELVFKHNILQKKFLKYLQDKYGKPLVKRECRTSGSARIDITRKAGSGSYIFYEIKTYNNLRSSIRESIGQLLEYCLYPDVLEAEKVVLVSHISPSEELVAYLNHIKKFLNIPFAYIHFDIDKEEIISEI